MCVGQNEFLQMLLSSTFRVQNANHQVHCLSMFLWKKQKLCKRALGLLLSSNIFSGPGSGAHPQGIVPTS